MYHFWKMPSWSYLDSQANLGYEVHVKLDYLGYESLPE